MDGQRIESICGVPIAENEPPSWFKVGTAWNQAVAVADDNGVEHPLGAGRSGRIVYRKHVVTAIELRVENRGDHGVGWYDVRAGEVLIASLNERNVHELYYEIPTGLAAG